MKKNKPKMPPAQNQKKNGEKVKLTLDDLKPVSDDQLANVWSA